MNETLRNLTDRRTPLPPNDIQPPTYGGPQRDAINSVVDNIVADICGKIAALRHTLDDIEHQVLSGAAGAKLALHGQVALCVKVNDEITHMQSVVADLKEASKEV